MTRTRIFRCPHGITIDSRNYRDKITFNGENVTLTELYIRSELELLNRNSFSPRPIFSDHPTMVCVCKSVAETGEVQERTHRFTNGTHPFGLDPDGA